MSSAGGVGPCYFSVCDVEDCGFAGAGDCGDAMLTLVSFLAMASTGRASTCHIVCLVFVLYSTISPLDQEL